ncbi:SRPBCC domain-containing protein [Sporichthya brevicatena]|uniref:SRPBCC domain-containing protein n=1 Tax=Sporichthya brevicatena TaxID=171442 RepID=A0ABN1GQ04_9ACTN
MTVTSVTKDATTRTMTLTAEFDAPVPRVWQLYDDPRRLEQWWGPPTYPATVVDHDLSVGGTVRYVMTGPEGDKSCGYWIVRAVDAPHSLEWENGFATDDLEPDRSMPVMTMRMTLAPRPGGGTVMTIATVFETAENMTWCLEMGMEEGMSSAVGQCDAVLAA